MDSRSECQMVEKAAKQAPASFKVTDELRRWASSEFPAVDINKETAKFCRYEFSHPKSNWDDQWKTWIQRADEFRQANGTPQEDRSNVTALRDLAPLLGVTKRENETDGEFLERVRQANDRRISRLNG